MSAQAILQRLGAPLTVLVLLTLWELAARALALDGFPTATESLAQLPAILFDGQSLQSIGASLARMFAGIGLALLVAVPAGLAMGRNPTLARMLNPLLSAAYPVPKAALMPMVMLWFGVGDLSKILVIFLGVSLPLLYHSYHARRGWTTSCSGRRGHGMRPGAALRITLPGALPEVLLGCRVGLAMALIVMISSEMIARQSGAGDLLFNALDMALYPDVYAMIVILAALGFALDWAFEHLRLRLVHWAEPRQDAASGGNS